MIIRNTLPLRPMAALLGAVTLALLTGMSQAQQPAKSAAQPAKSAVPPAGKAAVTAVKAPASAPG